MADDEADTAQLSTSQQETLQTYISVTSQEPSEAIPLLERSQWNVQVRFTFSRIGRNGHTLTSFFQDCNYQVL